MSAPRTTIHSGRQISIRASAPPPLTLTSAKAPLVCPRRRRPSHAVNVQNLTPSRSAGTDPKGSAFVVCDHLRFLISAGSGLRAQADTLRLTPGRLPIYTGMHLPAANRNPCIPGGLNVDLLREMIFFTNSTKKLFFVFLRQL